VERQEKDGDPAHVALRVRLEFGAALHHLGRMLRF
jgi:hypothetical protein